MNTAFYVSGNAGRLRKILKNPESELVRDTKLVFSDDERNIDLQVACASLGITFVCLHHEDIVRIEEKSKNRIMSDTLLALLQKHDISYCFSFGDHLLVGDLLHEYKNKIINFHPSVLPMYPGMQAIDQAIEANTNLLGNTAHFIDAGVDTGPIIMQNVVSAEVFRQGGYEAVLDQQLHMIHQIYAWLRADRLHIVDGKVVVINGRYELPAFFPALEPREVKQDAA
jgi:phosphoribosylglycinamide formyltransferase-1